jgi:translocation and assembly module TamB
MDLEVSIPNDFWVRGKDIDAELRGDLNVRKGASGLTVLGSLTTLRGTFSVANNDFRITTGEFRFNDVKSLQNVYIDLVATSRVIDEEIEITAKGNVDTLDIAATSESGWSETDIFKALTLRRGAESDQGGTLFSDTLLRSWGLALANRFGGDVARDLGLDEFGIEVAEPGQGNALPATRVTIGKYVSPKIYLKYSQSLERLYGSSAGQSPESVSFPEGQLNVEYRLSDKLSVAGETGMAGGFAYFDVDLKFSFGY